MTVITRTQSKALGQALDKSTSEEHDQASAASTGTVEPTTRKRLAMRTRDEAGDGSKIRVETQPLSRPRSSSSSNSIADSAAADDGDLTLEPQSASKQLEEEASQRLPDLEPSPPKIEKEGKSKHVVFGDDVDVDKYVAEATETSKREPKAVAQEEAEDSDDAPEAVSTKVAAKETLESAKALADATEKQATMLKRKRQERDNLFKQQAKKRKRVADQPETKGEAATAGRRRAEKLKLPNVLPAEFLADSSSESEDEDEEATLRRRIVNRPKKTNFEDRAPRDEVIGSTVYRIVAKQGNKKLAPKMHKDTRNVKEDMLRRKRAAVTPNKRKGFFIRK